MITMSAKEIKNNFGVFTENARRAPVIHTNHGRQTLVTLSIDQARNIPELREMIEEKPILSRQERISRFLALGGTGYTGLSAEDLAKRSAEFRGND